MRHGDVDTSLSAEEEWAVFEHDPDLWRGLSMSIEEYRAAFPCTCGEDDHPCLCGP